MGNMVIELAEGGPMDGLEVAVPKDSEEYISMEHDRAELYRLVYRDSGRRNERTGNRIFQRASRERVTQ